MDWYKTKKYTHFTRKLSDRDYSVIARYVSDTSEVARHAFHPLIHKRIVKRRYKKIKTNDGYVRSHTDGTKSNAKIREIFYATHIDSNIYSYYASVVLGKLYEGRISNYPELSECVIAYRAIRGNKNKGKCNIDFAKEVFDFIKDKHSCTALTFDITSFFDNLNHSYLKKSWMELLGVKRLPNDHFNIYKSLTNFSYVEETDLLKEIGIIKIRDRKKLQKILEKYSAYFKNPKEFRNKVCGVENFKNRPLLKSHPFRKKGIKRGIPQGTAISAFLANLYLWEFDKSVFEKIKNLGGLYRRYSDDIIVVCDQTQEEEMKTFIFDNINKYLLEIQEAKTEVSTFNEENGVLKTDIPLRYLGFEFNGSKIFIKGTSLSNYYRHLKKCIKQKVFKSEILKVKLKDPNQNIWYKHVYQRYSKYGRSNFVSYALRASKIMGEDSIKKQVRKHLSVINEYIAIRKIKNTNHL